MTTAQMTQAAPKMMDVRPPMPSPSMQAQQTTSTEIEIINDIPVQKAVAQKTANFSPIMSAEHDSMPTAADNVLHAASSAVKSQTVQPEIKKSRFGRSKPVPHQAASISEPKPIFETILLIVGCLVACGIVAVMFSAS